MGFSWISMGFSWIFMDFHWLLMDLNGILMGFGWGFHSDLAILTGDGCIPRSLVTPDGCGRATLLHILGVY